MHSVADRQYALSMYFSFIPKFEDFLCKVAARSSLKKRKSFGFDAIRYISEIDGDNFLRRYHKVRNGYPILTAKTLHKVLNGVEKLIEGDDELVSSSKDLANIHKEFYLPLAKARKNQPTGSFNKESTKKKFGNLLAASPFTENDLLNENHGSFVEFVDTVIEAPFDDGNIKECANNAHLLTNFLLAQKKDKSSILSDSQLHARIATAAHGGAWASQAIGNEALFRMFLNIIANSQPATIPRSAVAKGMIDLHEFKWLTDLSRPATSPLPGLYKAVEATQFLEDTGFAGDKETVMLNTIGQALREGANLDSRIGLTGDITIRSALEEINQSLHDPKNDFGSYHGGLLFHFEEELTRAYINQGELEKAGSLAEEINDRLEKTHKNHRYYKIKAKTLCGDIKRLRLNEIENEYYIDALDLCIEQGQYFRALGISKLMRPSV